MADAPSGSSWGALEIILVVVLVIGFFTQLQNGFTDPNTVDSSKSKETISSTTPEPVCGLTVSRPRSLEKITTFVTLTGQVSDCQWKATETVALYAQVIDSTGRPLSEYTAVAPQQLMYGQASFAATIYLNRQSTTTKGFVILAPAQNYGEETASYRIPVTFSR